MGGYGFDTFTGNTVNNYPSGEGKTLTMEEIIETSDEVKRQIGSIMGVYPMPRSEQKAQNIPKPSDGLPPSTIA